MVVVSIENGRKAMDRASPPLPFVFFSNSRPYMVFRWQPWVQVGSFDDGLPIGGRGVVGFCRNPVKFGRFLLGL